MARGTHRPRALLSLGRAPGGAFGLAFTFLGQGEELLLPSLISTAWVIKALPKPGCNDGVGGTPD